MGRDNRRLERRMHHHPLGTFRPADIRLHSHPSLEERDSYSSTSHPQKPQHSCWHVVTFQCGIFDDGHGLLRSYLVSSNQDVSAVKSGIDTLPLVLSLVVSSITAGAFVARVGCYVPFMIANGVIVSIGAGLITTFTPFTGHSKWIGYQVIFGFGLGLGTQQASLAAQVVLTRKDALIGIALIISCQQLGGAVFVSIGQNVFANELANGLRPISGINPAAVVDTGATEIRNVVNPDMLGKVLLAYNGALTKTFTAALVMACLSIVGALSMEWKNIKGMKHGGPGEGPSKPGAAEKSQAKEVGPEKNDVKPAEVV